MSSPPKTNLLQGLNQALDILDCSVSEVLTIAGLPQTFFYEDSAGVPPEDFNCLWEAVEKIADRDDFEYWFAEHMSKAPLVAPLVAFACSKDIYSGLQRLALFKPLIGPCDIKLKLTDNSLEVEILAKNIFYPLPKSHARFELAFLTNLFRDLTGRDIIPKSVELVDLSGSNEAARSVFYITPKEGKTHKIVLARDDAFAPLKSSSEVTLAALEPALHATLKTIEQNITMTNRVQSAIVVNVSSGPINAEKIASQIGVSKRTMQRRLREEDTSFQSILSGTRSLLAEYYLQKTTMQMFEIAYMLGFSDQSSFFRSFKIWTDTTPLEFRVLHRS